MTLNLKTVINDKYYPLLSNHDRYLLLYGGAGSGKSHFAAQKLLVRIIMSMKRGYKEKFLVLRKTQPAVKKSVFALLKHYIEQWELGGITAINKTDMTFTFEGGSEVICGGLDDPEKLKSIEGVTSVWLEEPTELVREDFLQADLRLRGETPSYKQIIFTFNPISWTSWLHSHFFESTQESSHICHSTYKDNRFLDREYVKVLESLKDQDETYYQIYCQGLWGILQDLIFTNWKSEYIPTDDQYYDSILNGLDFGFNHPSALLRVGLKDNELYIFDELYERGLTNNQLIPLVKAKVPSSQVITADSAEPARIEEFKQAGVKIKPSIKGAGSVKADIDWVKRHKIHVHPRCVNTIKELSGYKYKKDKNGNTIDEPVPFNDDAMAALRYSIEELVKSTPKAQIVYDAMDILGW
ncbi:MAG: Phage terminase, large subunit, family [Candidatus Poribacteria bacterium]|nr:Phage terminase, large subunit, family [Candidatus Poribacteria bacterium]MDQ1353052.1 Phage terminase, large subunit, family [Acidobacteriota bacterium]